MADIKKTGSTGTQDVGAHSTTDDKTQAAPASPASTRADRASLNAKRDDRNTTAAALKANLPIDRSPHALGQRYLESLPDSKGAATALHGMGQSAGSIGQAAKLIGSFDATQLNGILATIPESQRAQVKGQLMDARASFRKAFETGNLAEFQNGIQKLGGTMPALMIAGQLANCYSGPDDSNMRMVRDNMDQMQKAMSSNTKDQNVLLLGMAGIVPIGGPGFSIVKPAASLAGPVTEGLNTVKAGIEANAWKEKLLRARLAGMWESVASAGPEVAAEELAAEETVATSPTPPPVKAAAMVLSILLVPAAMLAGSHSFSTQSDSEVKTW